MNNLCSNVDAVAFDSEHLNIISILFVLLLLVCIRSWRFKIYPILCKEFNDMLVYILETGYSIVLKLVFSRLYTCVLDGQSQGVCLRCYSLTLYK